MSYLTPLQKKDIADKFLKWLQHKEITTCPSTVPVIQQASSEIGEPIYNIWKVYDLLRTMGRVELNSPNGRKGFKVLDYTPLAQYQLHTDGFRKDAQTDMLAQILRDLKSRYKYIWTEALGKIKER